MNLKDAVYHTVHDYPGGCESLAPRLKKPGEKSGMSPAVLRNKANPNTDTNVMSLDEADRIVGLTGDFRILHALAAKHDHVCIKIDADTPASDLAVLELVTHVWAANGSVGAAVDATLADNVVELHELNGVREAIYRTQQAMLAMLDRLERMAEPEGKHHG